MPTTDELLTILRTKGAQDVARDLKAIADAEANLGSKTSMASKVLGDQAAAASKTQQSLKDVGEAAAKAAAKQTATVEAQHAILRAQADVTMGQLDLVSDRWGRVGKSSGMAANVMGGAAAAGVGFGAWLVKGAMQAEGAIAQLKIALKDDSAAESAFQWAKKFADATPFITQSVVEASARLQISKLDMKEWTTVAGNMAAPFISSGKDITDAVEAIRDAVAGGGLERLKEFGITGSMLTDAGAAKSSGGGISYKTKEEVEKLKVALKKVVELNFGNAMAESFKTTAGAMSTLQGNMETFRAELGKMLIPDVTKLVATLGEWTAKLNALDDDQKKHLATILKYSIAVLGIGAAATKIISVLALWKSARAATAAANIARNLAEAASAEALAVAYGQASAASAMSGASSSVLSGIGRAGGATGLARVGLAGAAAGAGTLAKPLQVAGIAGLKTEIAALGVLLGPVATAAGMIIAGTALTGLAIGAEEKKATRATEDVKSAMDTVTQKVGAVNVDPVTGGRYGPGQLPSLEVFKKWLDERYGLDPKKLPGSSTLEKMGELTKRWRQVEQDFGVQPTGAHESPAARVRRVYNSWITGMGIEKQPASGVREVPSVQAYMQDVRVTPEQAKKRKEAAEKAARDALSKWERARQGQEKDIAYSGAGLSELMNSGWDMPSSGLEMGALGFMRMAQKQAPTSMVDVNPRDWAAWKEKLQTGVFNWLQEIDEESWHLADMWSEDYIATLPPGTIEAMGGMEELQRQRREAYMGIAKQAQARANEVLDWANGFEEEQIALAEYILSGIDAGMIPGGDRMKGVARGMRDVATGNYMDNLQRMGRGKDRWKLGANLQRTKFDELHGDAGKRLAILGEKTQLAMQGEQDARAFADMPAADMQRIQQQARALGLNTASPGSEDIWKQKVVTGFNEQLDFLSEMMSTSTGAMFDGYRKQYNEVARQWQDYAMQSVDMEKQKWEPKLSREIIATGGLSGLSELMISQVVAGGMVGRGQAGLNGPLSLGGPAADRLRAGGGDALLGVSRNGNRSLTINFNGRADDAQMEETVNRALDGTMTYLQRVFSVGVGTMRMIN